MPSARDEILSTLRKQVPLETPNLPEVIEGNWIHYSDPVEHFSNLIAAVGGSCHSVTGTADVLAQLQSYSQFNTAKRIYSQVPGIPSHFDLAVVGRPQDLEDLDFVIYPGEFAIAENGAIWVTDKDLKHRVIFFITQHLVLVVRKSNLLHTMHEAYGRIEFTEPRFGLFISGPSKTADIEQSLVIGAHGCRSMQVYLIDG
jgi:L-lactate dehydrogenase complex protein LldG